MFAMWLRLLLSPISAGVVISFAVCSTLLVGSAALRHEDGLNNVEASYIKADSKIVADGSSLVFSLGLTNDTVPSVGLPGVATSLTQVGDGNLLRQVQVVLDQKRFKQTHSFSQCIDFDGSGSSNNGISGDRRGVKMWDCGNTAKWEFVAEGDAEWSFGTPKYGLIRWKPPNPDKVSYHWCLDVSSGEYNKKPNGASVILYPCDRTVARWAFTPHQQILFWPHGVPAKTFKLEDKQYFMDNLLGRQAQVYDEEYCLDFKGSENGKGSRASKSGDKVQVWKCENSYLYVDPQVFSKHLPLY